MSIIRSVTQIIEFIIISRKFVSKLKKLSRTLNMNKNNLNFNKDSKIKLFTI